ncbi:MAG: tetraacyldisaccharide 4'-kinase, partial [Succinivibrio sp.]
TDDGLQHYSLCRDIEIVVLDGRRMLGNGLLLPAGPLREGKWHLESADFTVINGVSDNPKYYSMNLVPNSAVSLHSCFDSTASHDYLQKGCSVAVLAGIGNPERVYHTVEQCGYRIEKKLCPGDHRVIDEKFLREVSALMPVIMTAKDAVKYAHLDLGNLFVLGVDAHLPDTFYDRLIEKIKDLKK